jgi:two-component sensor histidine kinase
MDDVFFTLVIRDITDRKEAERQIKTSLDESVRDVVKTCQNRVRSMALIHEKLYRSRDFANVIKHAFPSTSHGTKQLRITVRPIDETHVNLVFKDSGYGIPEESDLSKTDSLGLQLVANLVESQLGGTVEFKNADGTECNIALCRQRYRLITVYHLPARL